MKFGKLLLLPLMVAGLAQAGELDGITQQPKALIVAVNDEGAVKVFTAEKAVTSDVEAQASIALFVEAKAPVNASFVKKDKSELDNLEAAEAWHYWYNPYYVYPRYYGYYYYNYSYTYYYGGWNYYWYYYRW